MVLDVAISDEKTKTTPAGFTEWECTECGETNLAPFGEGIPRCTKTPGCNGRFLLKRLPEASAAK
jgi:hypothetical protein